ncbi:uncharacterized protein E0L32_009162 [Thyridium curvatum]|uniref:RRM domain-containing protein n=1 Tax=Thyridium curvatum TaxID=1093900 RepID=A0A507AXH5_9PEZI|nr:uncharacterized protein E0L32_009162 [Thyridium curvatum]TPX09689.1 hypothetical protein E0L32_009162 [Thyridium curvatum]
MSNKHWEQNKDATIYVGNLDERFAEGLLWELMTQMGPVVNVHMPMDRVSRTHQGYGFVEFDTPESADYAARCLNGIRVYGKPIRVNKASADKQRAAENIGAELFVNNLDPQVDEKILYDTFGRFGQLVSPPSVIRDQNNVSKGYGFVSFDSFEASDTARDAMNGQYLLSKQVTVEYAYKKDGKGERHGDEAERKLAAEGKKHNIVPEQQPLPPAFLMSGPAAGPPGAGAAAPPATAPPPGPVAPGFAPSPVAGAPPMAAGMPAGFATPPPVAGGGIRPPPQQPAYGAPPPHMAAAGRGSALPPAPSGLPARPPPSQGGYNGPQDYHHAAAAPGYRGAPPPPPAMPGAPPMGAPPQGFGAPPPPGFGGANGAAVPPPTGYMPPPGFGAPPPGQAPAGFGRR